MRSATVRLAAMLGVTSLVTGCQDTLEPHGDYGILTSRLGGGSSILTASAVSPTQVDLSWSDNSPNESGYEVHRSTDGQNGSFGLIGGTGVNGTSYSDGELTPKREYCYKVRAFKTSGRKTTYSTFLNTSCATTPALLPPPPPPEGPVSPSGTNARPPAGHYSHTVEVTWTDNSADEEGFHVERSATESGPWETVWTAGASSTSAYVYGQPEEQRLCYRVTAFKGRSESPSNVDCTYLPTGPTNLTATAVGIGQVDLAWSDNSAGEDGYDIERSETGYQPFTLVATVGANTTSYHDTGVADNTTYWYFVAAKYEGGRSGVLGVASVVIASAAANAPLATNVTTNGSTSALVRWTDNSSNEVAFRVERSQDGGATWTFAGSADVNYPAFYDWELPSDQQYCYRVIASNGVGDSPPSNSDCTTLIKAPTDLVVVAIDDQTIEYRWRDNSGLEDGYQAWFVGYDGYYYYIDLPSNRTNYQASIYDYLYGVIAVKEGGYSDWLLLYPGETTAALRSPPLAGKRSPTSAQRTPPRIMAR